MEIKVRTNDLYDLSDYLTEVSNQLAEDSSYISSLSDSLSQVLHGVGQQSISTRISNFNNTQFTRLSSYARNLSSQLEMCAKLYDSEESDFAEKMKREASKYSSGTVNFSDAIGGRMSNNSYNHSSNSSSKFNTNTQNNAEISNNFSSSEKVTNVENRPFENNTVHDNFNSSNDVQATFKNTSTPSYTDYHSGHNSYSSQSTFNQTEVTSTLNNSMESTNHISSNMVDVQTQTAMSNMPSNNEQFSENSLNMSGVLAGGVLAAGGLGVAGYKKNKDEEEK